MDLRKPCLMDMILNGWGEKMTYINKKYFGEHFKRVYITDDNDNLLEFCVFHQRFYPSTSLAWGEKMLNSKKLRTVFYFKKV